MWVYESSIRMPRAGAQRKKKERKEKVREYLFQHKYEGLGLDEKRFLKFSDLRRKWDGLMVHPNIIKQKRALYKV